MYLAKAILPTCQVVGDARSKVESIWNSLIEWGVSNPNKRSAIRQLLVSDRISVESRQFCKTLFQDAIKVIKENLVGKIDTARASFILMQS